MRQIEHEIAQEQALLRVTAIVVSYNSAHCIPALAQGLAALPHIIVVDNGSTDSSLAAILALVRRIIVAGRRLIPSLFC